MKRKAGREYEKLGLKVRNRSMEEDEEAREHSERRDMWRAILNSLSERADVEGYIETACFMSCMIGRQ